MGFFIFFNQKSEEFLYLKFKFLLMFEFLDSIEFNVFYLIYLCLIAILGVTMWKYGAQGDKTKKLKFLLRISIIIAFGLLILDSIPYLYTDFFTIPIGNIILSNISLLLLSIAFIFYGFLIIEKG